MDPDGPPPRHPKGSMAALRSVAGFWPILKTIVSARRRPGLIRGPPPVPCTVNKRRPAPLARAGLDDGSLGFRIIDVRLLVARAASLCHGRSSLIPDGRLQ